MERKLATVRKIKEIRQIEGADDIECIIIDGWQCVAKKNEFNIGDLCVYCEIDSVLPPRPEFAFLEKVKYRIKTAKFRGCISQGIVFPISILSSLPTIYDINYAEKDKLVGKDVTDLLGITKYEPPIPAQLAGKVKGNFPSFLKKTDEERIQNMEWVLTEYKDELFYITEKLDGTSFTAYYNNGVFGVCSRNLDLYETEDNTHWRIARELKLEEKMKEYGENISLQGELIGDGINKNRLKIKGHDIKFFDVFDIDKYKYYDYETFVERIFQFGLQTVPIISHTTGFKLLSTMSEMVDYSKGKSMLNPIQEREGIVVRPFKNIKHPKYGRISFKVINPIYLLKYEE